MIKKITLFFTFAFVSLSVYFLFQKRQQEDFKSFITQSLQEPREEDISKIFLLLLANLGIQNEVISNYIILDKEAMRNILKEKDKLENENKKLVDTIDLLKNESLISQKEIQNKPDKELTLLNETLKPQASSLYLESFHQPMSGNKLKEALKESYILVSPLEIVEGKYQFTIEKKFYSSRPEATHLELEINMKHNGRYFEGTINSSILSMSKVVEKLKEDGINKSVLNIKDQAIALYFSKHIITFPIQIKDRKKQVNFSQGTIYTKSSKEENSKIQYLGYLRIDE